MVIFSQFGLHSVAFLPFYTHSTDQWSTLVRPSDVWPRASTDGGHIPRTHLHQRAAPDPGLEFLRRHGLVLLDVEGAAERLQLCVGQGDSQLADGARDCFAGMGRDGTSREGLRGSSHFGRPN